MSDYCRIVSKANGRLWKIFLVDYSPLSIGVTVGCRNKSCQLVSISNRTAAILCILEAPIKKKGNKAYNGFLSSNPILTFIYQSRCCRGFSPVFETTYLTTLCEFQVHYRVLKVFEWSRIAISAIRALKPPPEGSPVLLVTHAVIRSFV